MRLKGERSGRAAFDAFAGHFLQAALDALVEWRGDADIKTTTDKGQSERLAGQFRQLHANATEDAFAGFEDNSAGLDMLLERAALLAVTAGVGFIKLGVGLERAIA